MTKIKVVVYFLMYLGLIGCGTGGDQTSAAPQESAAPLEGNYSIFHCAGTSGVSCYKFSGMDAWMTANYCPNTIEFKMGRSLKYGKCVANLSEDEQAAKCRCLCLGGNPC